MVSSVIANLINSLNLFIEIYYKLFLFIYLLDFW